MTGSECAHSGNFYRLDPDFTIAADGSLSNKRVFAEFSEADGYPDGMTTDAEGCL